MRATKIALALLFLAPPAALAFDKQVGVGCSGQALANSITCGTYPIVGDPGTQTDMRVNAGGGHGSGLAGNTPGAGGSGFKGWNSQYQNRGVAGPWGGSDIGTQSLDGGTSPF